MSNDLLPERPNARSAGRPAGARIIVGSEPEREGPAPGTPWARPGAGPGLAIDRAALPPEVAEVVSRLLHAVDAARPGLVAGLYLCGSVAYGDFCPGTSDVDFLSLLSRRPDADDVRALAGAHEQVAGSGPTLDGSHLTAEQFAAGPDASGRVPGSTAEGFGAAGRAGLCPVTWHELRDGGVVVRGPEVETLGAWHDDGALREYSRINLEQYWVPRLRALRAAPAGQVARPQTIQWHVLGVTRLHYLLGTGRQTSKSGAGYYALARFEERWHPIVSTSLQVRTGGTPDARPDDVVAGEVRDYLAMVIEASRSL